MYKEIFILVLLSISIFTYEEITYAKTVKEPFITVDKMLQDEHHNNTLKQATYEVNQHIEKLKPQIQENLQGRITNFDLVYTGKDVKNDVKQAILEVLLQDEYLGYDFRGYQYEWNGYDGNYKINVVATYIQTWDQEQYVQQEVKKIVQDYITSDMSVHRRIKVLHDFVVTHITYDVSGNQQVNAPYFALTEGKTLCNGYAMLMYRLLQETDIPVRLISGEAGTGSQLEAHAWNLVQVNNDWYHLDPTWNDPVPDKGQDVSYAYYMLTDDQIQRDHFWQEGGLNNRENTYPVATASYYDTLLEDNQEMLLKELGWWLEDYQIVTELVELSDAIIPNLDVRKSNFRVVYTGDDKNTVEDTIDQIINLANQHSDYASLKRYSVNINTIIIQGKEALTISFQNLKYYDPIQSLYVETEKSRLIKGETVQLKTYAITQNGKKLDVTNYATYQTRKASMARISQGQLKTLIGGSVTLSAHYEGVEAIHHITVDGTQVINPVEGYNLLAEKKDIKIDKEWIIYLSQQVNEKNVPQVVMMNEVGEKIDVAIAFDKNQLYVKAPITNYEKGQTYYLTVSFKEAEQNIALKFHTAF